MIKERPDYELRVSHARNGAYLSSARTSTAVRKI